MKTHFFVSLELYIRKIIQRNQVPYPFLLIGFVMVIVGISLIYQRQSMVHATSLAQAVRTAAAQGDYSLAQRLLEQRTENIEYRELEEIAYPEKKILARITELEERLNLYPGDRDIYKILANLYAQIDNQEKAREYSEQARILDPNENN